MGGGQVDRAAMERRLGLDLPIHVQYGRWIGDIVLRGTLGESLIGGWRIEERLLGRLPVTAELGLLAILIGLVIALPVGIYSAVRQYTAADYVGRSVAIMGLATPNFWLGTMVMIYPDQMGLVAADGAGPVGPGPAGNLGMFLISQPDPRDLPGGQHHAHDAHHGAIGAAPGLHQDRLGQGAAGAVGDPRHAVKNAIIPVVTLVGMQLPILVGGAVIIENTFNLPGLGRLILDALGDRVREQPLGRQHQRR